MSSNFLILIFDIYKAKMNVTKTKLIKEKNIKGCVYFGSRLIKGFKMSWLEITSGYATAYKLNPIYEYVSMVEKKERIDIFFDVLFSSDVCKKKSFFSAKLLIT